MNVKYFKTVCIIMIIIGVLNLVSSIGGQTGVTLSVLSTVVSILSGAGLLVAGFIGYRAAKSGDADKAPLCRTISYVLLGITLVGVVLSFIESANTSTPGVSSSLVASFAIIGSIVSFILPVLYFLGARKLGE